MNTIYTVFREEVGRRRENGGMVIVPEVMIRTPGVTISLTNVEVQPHNLIGTSIVRNFFVELINEYVSYARCGFVYESGSYRFRGNHIHLHSDTRVLNSPEYLEYFCICI